MYNSNFCYLNMNEEWGSVLLGSWNANIMRFKRSVQTFTIYVVAWVLYVFFDHLLKFMFIPYVPESPLLTYYAKVLFDNLWYLLKYLISGLGETRSTFIVGFYSCQRKQRCNELYNKTNFARYKIARFSYSVPSIICASSKILYSTNALFILSIIMAFYLLLIWGYHILIWYVLLHYFNY